MAHQSHTNHISRPRPQLLFLAAMLVCGPTAPVLKAQGQGPIRSASPGQFEVPGFDFRPEGAWRRLTKAIRLNRRQLLRAGTLSTLNLKGPGVFGTRVTGSYRVPVVPIAFPNVAPPFPKNLYQEALFDPAPTSQAYTIKTFYAELSNGNIALDGVVLRWVTADSVDTYYEDGCNGIGITPCGHPGVGGVSARLAKLFRDALIAEDNGTVDWGRFDNDGPDGLPNSGDDDGVVDFVTFLQPEVDGACGTSNLWAHRYYLSALSGSSTYVTKTPRSGGGFVTVDDYTLQSAVGGADACTAGAIMPIGIVAHETGHAFGLPDLYDTGPSISLRTSGIGEWGLMGSGSYARPYSPSRYEAWSLAELGWVTVDTLGTSKTVRLGPVTSSDTVLYVPVPGTDEYFLLENRQAFESDTAQMNADCRNRTRICAKSPGLLVWHIDQGQVDAHGLRAGDNGVNVGPVHGVALLQADGLGQLDGPGTSNRGDPGDAYPGSSANQRVSATSTPPGIDNQDQFVGFRLDSIHQEVPQGAMVFRFVRHPPSVFAAGLVGALVKVNGLPLSRFEDIIPSGDTVALDADLVQYANGGRSRFQFQQWSDGLPARHTLTAGAGPDTVIAVFTLEHELKVTSSGSGTITASSPGNLATGILVSAGASVTLSAAPGHGLIFAGWTGDTLSAHATVTLPMNRPYALTATFTAQVPVSQQQAARAILGTATLSAAQRTYLDLIGNKNGGYDLGDLVAYLQLTGATPAPKGH